ncbi:hypothetical protein GCM10007276_19790 [Agaricicola taiwanensis]|uniref:Stringent starvation protein B n=1 Tax=Agaricicola taiwanensis TaxID=591372 RepID=A0A8J2YEJ6_9RHOB|nr:ClpXP protease specificity-enhancing factor SspB [Agaricicola taiwanensis]GGE42534.1 hypothetical protein GCM10007276_19790 [Agaricicola taiwanensis]
MPTDLIRYDLRAQEALRGLVRKVLSDVARDGLPGEHHFFVSFRTGAPGVKLSPRLREQHPEEMTIVLQHQFWDLEVMENHFTVGLSFGGVPEKLVVPYEALVGFYDPSVQFGLKFEIAESAPAVEDEVISAPSGPGADITSIAKPSGSEAEPKADADEPAAASDDGEGGAQVVSLDKFRKK